MCISKIHIHCIRNHRWKFVYLTLASIFFKATTEKLFFVVVFFFFYFIPLFFSFLRHTHHIELHFLWSHFLSDTSKRRAISINYPSKLGFCVTAMTQRHTGNHARTHTHIASVRNSWVKKKLLNEDFRSLYFCRSIGCTWKKSVWRNILIQIYIPITHGMRAE